MDAAAMEEANAISLLNILAWFWGKWWIGSVRAFFISNAFQLNHPDDDISNILPYPVQYLVSGNSSIKSPTILWHSTFVTLFPKHCSCSFNNLNKAFFNGLMGIGKYTEKNFLMKTIQKLLMLVSGWTSFSPLLKFQHHETSKPNL